MLRRDLDPALLSEMLGEEYEQWLDANYTLLEIEDGEIMSFDKWFNHKQIDHAENFA